MGRGVDLREKKRDSADGGARGGVWLLPGGAGPEAERESGGPGNKPVPGSGGQNTKIKSFKSDTDHADTPRPSLTFAGLSGTHLSRGASGLRLSRLASPPSNGPSTPEQRRRHDRREIRTAGGRGCGCACSHEGRVVLVARATEQGVPVGGGGGGQGGEARLAVRRVDLLA